MGQCGCGDFSPEEVVKFGNHILAIEIYPGCDDCETGLISTLHVFTPEYAADWRLEPEKEFKPDQYGQAQIDIPLMGKEDLIEALNKIREEVDPEEYDNFEDFLQDYGLRLLQEAFFIRRKKTKQNR